MTMKNTFVLLLLFGGSHILYPQFEKTFISFPVKEHNFGIIKETDGIVTIDFEFVNTGKVPLIIRHVQTTCGCTSPEWTKDPIIPGQQGRIKVSYNPNGRPGPFLKPITVTSNADPGIDTLIIKGSVVSVQLSKPAEDQDYKYSIGDLKLRNVYASFGEIRMGSYDTVSIDILNASVEKTLRPGFLTVPDYLTVAFVPEVLSPGEKGTIIFICNSSKRNEWDTVIDRLFLTLNGERLPSNTISLTAIIKEDFSGLSSEELANAPVASFDSGTFDFGTVTGDITVEHNFVLTNTGKSDLYIRKVAASCGCTAVQPSKTTIAPGESTAVKVFFDTHGRSGTDKKSITLITNDPKRPKTYLWIKATVDNKVMPAEK
jgi:hypothetical protein